jgi:thymidylate synthase (FAD)
MNKTSNWNYDGSLKQSDVGLVRYLAEHNHWTPFAHVVVTLRLAMPIFIARQWFKHTVGGTRNEVSRRYVDDQPEYFLPEILRARPDGSIKQGSGDEHPNSKFWLDAIKLQWQDVDYLYERMIADGVAPEQARIILPMGHMTEFYETASLSFYARAAGLRLDGHAQKEIRDLMLLVAEAVQPIAPVSWDRLVGKTSP